MKEQPSPRLTRSVTAKLSAPLAARLAATARKHGMTRSAVLREALQERIERENLSFLDLAGDSVGAIEGPGDLSTNKSHLWKRRRNKAI